MATSIPKRVFTERFTDSFQENYPNAVLSPEAIGGIIMALIELFKDCKKEKNNPANTLYSIQKGRITGLFAKRRMKKAIRNVDTAKLKESDIALRDEISDSVISALKASTVEEIDSYILECSK